MHSLQQVRDCVSNAAGALRATREFLAEDEGQAAETDSAESKSDPMTAPEHRKVLQTGRMIKRWPPVLTCWQVVRNAVSWK